MTSHITFIFRNNDAIQRVYVFERTDTELSLNKTLLHLKPKAELIQNELKRYTDICLSDNAAFRLSLHIALSAVLKDTGDFYSFASIETLFEKIMSNFM